MCPVFFPRPRVLHVVGVEQGHVPHRTVVGNLGGGADMLHGHAVRRVFEISAHDKRDAGVMQQINDQTPDGHGLGVSHDQRKQCRKGHHVLAHLAQISGVGIGECGEYLELLAMGMRNVATSGGRSTGSAHPGREWLPEIQSEK